MMLKAILDVRGENGQTHKSKGSLILQHLPALYNSLYNLINSDPALELAIASLVLNNKRLINSVPRETVLVAGCAFKLLKQQNYPSIHDMCCKLQEAVFGFGRETKLSHEILDITEQTCDKPENLLTHLTKQLEAITCSNVENKLVFVLKADPMIYKAFFQILEGARNSGPDRKVFGYLTCAYKYLSDCQQLDNINSLFPGVHQDLIRGTRVLDEGEFQDKDIEYVLDHIHVVIQHTTLKRLSLEYQHVTELQQSTNISADLLTMRNLVYFLLTSLALMANAVPVVLFSHSNAMATIKKYQKILNETHEKKTVAAECVKPNIDTITSIKEFETKHELLKSLHLIKPGVVFPQIENLTKLNMLAHTNKMKTMISFPCVQNHQTLPNHAIYLGRANVFQRCKGQYVLLQGFGNLDSNFTQKPVTTVAIPLSDVAGLEAIINVHKGKVIVYLHMDANQQNHYFALVFMKEIPQDECVLLINEITPPNKCATRCGQKNHNMCMQERVEQRNKGKLRFDPCPCCQRQLKTIAGKVSCVGEPEPEYDETWVKTIIRFEHKLPKALVHNVNPAYLKYYPVDDTTFKKVSESFAILFGICYTKKLPTIFEIHRFVALYILQFKYTVQGLGERVERGEILPGIITELAHDNFEQFKLAPNRLDSFSIITLEEETRRVRNSANFKYHDSLYLDEDALIKVVFY